MTRYTREWWEKQYTEEDSQNELVRDAAICIQTILDHTGKWNHNISLLQVQCGLGALVHLMNDAGFQKVRGIDNDPAVSVFWEDDVAFSVQAPWDTEFDNSEFGYVAWFPERIQRQEEKFKEEDILKEIKRISAKYFFYRPSIKYDSDTHKVHLNAMLNLGWVCIDFNPIKNIYLFEEG